jgi:catechol 2,3-dioxygenase-like lactoylglutathione lyase family enzyme
MAMLSRVTAGRAHRAAPITGLSHVQLGVSNRRASALWYTAALGLELQAEDVDTGYVALRHRQARLVVVLSMSSDPGTSPEAGTDAADTRTAGSPGSLDHLAFAVPDQRALGAWADHLTAIGVRHGGVVLENGNPSLQLRDPDGNAIELVAPARPGPGRWGPPGAPARHPAG